MRIVAMIKANNVTGGAGIVASAAHFDEQRKFIQVSAKRDTPVRGSTGWLKYAATLEVPEDAEMLEYGVRLEGAGTVWIDGIALEVVP
jgi:hypothetical protein